MSVELLQPNRQLTISSSPIFTIGAPRSGSHGLAYSLAQHSQLWTHGESDILLPLLGNNSQLGARLDFYFQRAYQRPLPTWSRMYGVDKAELLKYMGAGLNALFTSKNPGKRWIDKTPQYVLIADILADLFPDAFFIHILRDGRRVVNSMIHYLDRFNDDHKAQMIQGGFAPLWIVDFREACKTWRQYLQVGMDF